jgi:choline dehydrogenase
MRENMHFDLEFDYVIVGAGSAGCAVAGRLAENGRYTVALVEAGPRSGGMPTRIPAAWVRLFKSRVDWNYATVPQPALDNRRIYWPRGRVVGGCSAINAQMYVRGAAEDFDGWAAAGNPVWDFASLLQEFVASERNGRGAGDFHGDRGPLHVCDPVDLHPLTRAFLQAGEAAGITPNPDFNGATLDGIGAVQLTQRRGVRWSAADAYLRKRPNLAVLPDAVVLRILLDGRRAQGVLLREGGVERRVRAVREVVLCAGTVGSPQILMLSGVGPAEELQRHGIPVVHDLPGVGSHLQDHVAAGVLAGIRTKDSMLAAESPGNLLRYLFLRRGMLASNAAEAAAFIRSRPGLPAPDLELILVPVLYMEEGLARPHRHGLTIGAVALQPESRGNIRLASRDPCAKPLIDPNYLADPRDLEVLATGIRTALGLLAQPPLRAVVDEVLAPSPADPEGIAAHIRSTAHTLYHPVGTCRMGPDPLSVVDAGLRVHGIGGLRVADASVMPRIPRGHTHAATVAIGERAASLLLGRVDERRFAARPAYAGG